MKRPQWFTLQNKYFSTALWFLIVIIIPWILIGFKFALMCLGMHIVINFITKLLLKLVKRKYERRTAALMALIPSRSLSDLFCHQQCCHLRIDKRFYCKKYQVNLAQEQKWSAGKRTFYSYIFRARACREEKE